MAHGASNKPGDRPKYIAKDTANGIWQKIYQETDKHSDKQTKNRQRDHSQINRPAHRQTNKPAPWPTDRHQETKQSQIDRP